MHGQCNARPTVTFPVAGHRCCTNYQITLFGNKQRHMRVNNLPKVAVERLSHSYHISAFPQYLVNFVNHNTPVRRRLHGSVPYLAAISGVKYPLKAVHTIREHAIHTTRNRARVRYSVNSV